MVQMAYIAIQLAAGLFVHPPWWKPSWYGKNVCRIDANYVIGRTLAWGGLDIYCLGGASWGLSNFGATAKKIPAIRYQQLERNCSGVFNLQLH